jgi:hypothetical protein
MVLFLLTGKTSIVAVLRLNRTARKTWKDPVTGKLWLEDFLPEAHTRSLIMTFAYDSALAFNKAMTRAEAFPRDLLNRLRLAWSYPEVCILFVKRMRVLDPY